MEEQLNSLESFQALHTELLALSEKRLRAVDRLEALLQAHIQGFKSLLDKKPRSEQSRRSIESGKLDVPDENGDYATYEINTEFQQGALQLADELDLDEIQAAQLFWDGQKEANTSGRSILSESIVRFHQRRRYLLNSLRVLLSIQLDEDLDDHEAFGRVKEGLGDYVESMLRPSSPQESRLSTRCISSMGDVRSWLQKISEKTNTASILGNGAQAPEVLEIMDYQRESLLLQHECLGIIVEKLVKMHHSDASDFEMVVGALQKADKYDNVLVHEFPAFGACVFEFGSPEGSTSIEEARMLHAKLFKQREHNEWVLRYVYAACQIWWLAEYSGWYAHGGSYPDIDVTQELTQCDKECSDALKDGAFDFLLAMSADVKKTEWYDAARDGLKMWLVRRPMTGFAISLDAIPFSPFFQDSLMEELETYIDGLVMNLSHFLREVRAREELQRQTSLEHEHDLDFERLVVIMSYIFEDRPLAVMERFWGDPDSSLYGFLVWTSTRASTPLVSAFCELLRALSGDEQCAKAVHGFMLDDGSYSSSMKRNQIFLSWNELFKELTFFTNKIRDQPILQPQAYRTTKTFPDPAELEPESTLMLESYLRLISQVCTANTEARMFVTQNPAFQLIEVLFQLASSSIPARLRACAFTALTALLNHKSRNIGDHLWLVFDQWITGGQVPGTISNKVVPQSIFLAASPDAVLRKFIIGFEEPLAFSKLLEALLAPCEEESKLCDGLPFPESLGASHRVPGVDPYLDFGVGDIFGIRSMELTDPVERHLLQLVCLNSIATCLSTFNEDLVVFANTANVKVDVAIRASNLQQYVLLHPFGRIMEWMYNSSVMRALFSAATQDASEVAKHPANSPLVLCLLQSISVIILVMKLQSTYLDIVRPLIKQKRGHRLNPVPNTAFTSFEDGVLNYLDIISNLGLYCGSGHPEVIIASLELLEILCASPKITATREGRRGRNRVIAALEASTTADAISRSFIGEIDTELDVDSGADSPGFVIKTKILDVLSTCLLASPSSPNVAHLLLGFDCTNDTIRADPDPEGPFNRDISLFHAILNLAINLSLSDESEANLPLWQVSLKHRCLQLLTLLWRTPLSSDVVLSVILSTGAVFELLLKQIPIQQGLLWDGRDLADPDFMLTSSATCLCAYMSQRALAFQYIAAQLRYVARNHAPAMKQRILESLLGSTSTDTGPIPNPSVFDLLDFMDVQFHQTLEKPLLSWAEEINFSVCLDDADDPDSNCDIVKLQELLALIRAELAHAGRLDETLDIILVDTQTQEMITYYKVDNQVKLIRESRLQLLRSWVQLLIVMIQTNNFESTKRVPFILKTLQVVLPRLESNLDNLIEVSELANLIKACIFALDASSTSLKSDIGQLISDRLLHVFATSLKALTIISAESSLKETFYSISYRYLTLMSDHTGPASKRPISSIVKSASERLMEILCDDALTGEASCRMAALLLLGALIKLGKQKTSFYVLEALVRLNFISLLVQTIPTITQELGQASKQNIQLYRAHIDARLALLTHIAQTRAGANAVLNAGIFHAITASRLVALDPELDLDIDDPTTLPHHNHLLTVLLRLLITIILSKGTQNEQTIDLGRRFITEHRNNFLGVLKRASGRSVGIASQSGGVGGEQEGWRELADGMCCLVSVVGFVEFEEQVMPKRRMPGAFT